MANPASIIYRIKSFYNVFNTNYRKWSNGYPKLYFSNNFNANNETLPNYIGLYSFGIGYN